MSSHRPANRRPNILSNENGKTTTLAMIICLCAMIFYFQTGRAQVAASLPPIVDALTVLTLITISIFCIGCAVHMIMIGEVSLREYREKIEQSASELTVFSDSIATHLEVREQQCCATGASLGNRTIRALSTSKRISTALNDRILKVNQLLQSSAKTDLEAAFELLRAPLETDGDCCNQLILGDPIEPIERDDLGPFMQSLFEDIDFGLQGFHKKDSAPARSYEETPSEEDETRARRPTIH